MKTVNEMAIEAWGAGHEIFWFDDDGIERFAALVAAAERELVLAAAIDGAEHAARKAVIDEREACAKVCDARALEYDGFSAEQNASEKLAAAIRARGQA